MLKQIEKLDLDSSGSFVRYNGERLTGRIGPIRSIDTIIVGVQNINEAIELWVNQFGLDIVQKEGIDADLSRLQLEDDEITKQALLATPKNCWQNSS